MRRSVLSLLAVSAFTAKSTPTCCWSKWGDATTCGDYVGPGGRCNTDSTVTCISDSDCALVPPTPPAPTPPAPTPPAPTPPAPTPPAPTPPAPTPPAPTPPSPSRGLPKRTVGLYLLIDDSSTPYNITTKWTPVLPDYMTQAGGPNVFWLAFVNPVDMAIPDSMVHVSRNRPAGSLVIPSVGGYTYSLNPNPWAWLESASAAEAMAAQVATWPSKYGFDGIDLDIETGAGDAAGAGPNMMAFVRKLKALVPTFIITQPVFGYPGVKEEEYVPNESWKSGSTAGVDAIGIMVYSGTNSLQYVKNYVEATSQWQGFPITSDVPSGSVILGCGGDAVAGDIETLASATRDQDLGGFMVWYASVNDAATGKPAIQYANGSPDASVKSTVAEWSKALSIMQGSTETILV